MTVPRTCRHGVPFGKDDYCAGCDLISERGGLEWSLLKAERHRKRIAEIEAALGNTASRTASGEAAAPSPDAELGPGRNT